MPNVCLPIRPNTYIGPLTINQQRLVTPSLDPNDTPSLKDRTVQASIDKKKKREFVVVTQQEAARFVASPEVNYREMIEEHLERRVAFFFQQLVCCYQTHLHFEIGHTDDQYGSAKGLQLLDQAKRKLDTLGRQAAHSSTLTSLVAYRAHEWRAYELDPSPNKVKPAGFAFMRLSDMYRNMNSTLEMATEVNKADLEIDGYSVPRLRKKAIELLNRASAGEIDPVEGTMRFMQKVIAITTRRIQLAKKEKVKRVLRVYKECLENIRTDLRNTPEHFDRLLGVQSDPSPEMREIKKTAYQIRYQAIREAQLGQSELLEKINATRDAILQVLNRGRRPSHFEYAFRAVLLEEAPAGTREALGKLYNFPHYDLRETQKRMRGVEASKQLVRQSLPMIKNLIKDVRTHMRGLKRDEIEKRGATTRFLRHAHMWTQTRLAIEMRAKYPQLPASQATMSRIERNVKLIDQVYATALSRVFRVDSGLFMPAFFFS